MIFMLLATAGGSLFALCVWRPYGWFEALEKRQHFIAGWLAGAGLFIGAGQMPGDPNYVTLAAIVIIIAGLWLNTYALKRAARAKLATH
jgi:hypothetical protein